MRQQQSLAFEAARLMTEEGFDSLPKAKRKAAKKLGLENPKDWPDDSLILSELSLQRSLFQSNHHQVLYDLRETALKAMQLFATFKPRLMGALVSGYASEQTSIDILLTANTAEEIALELMQQQIPYQIQEHSLHYERSSTAKKNPIMIPVYQFYAAQQQIKLMVLEEQHHKKSPFDPATGQAFAKLSIEQLKRLQLKI
ncbi:hypothetical protein [sulfur-oxidizing endosymbiont of Gigantopelta aegis]|uniref:hypothetical protein n=1 Tax=sulfur-oxidizing endosymbiont of Gigantopelta aegis TaxID=2794934 RepID=UPI0018DCE9C8|nr:hypothetical protein [sulfur-oxidizing endosymbiont of Gigantopelta aegis]